MTSASVYHIIIRDIKETNTVLFFHLQPLLHAIIFLIEMSIVARLTARYNAYYGERPGMYSIIDTYLLESSAYIFLERSR